MQFIRKGPAEGIKALSAHLTKQLTAGKSTLWLVPGGSNIPFVVEVMSNVPDDLTKKLTIMLTDERYGPIGHADSNAQQLQKAGFQPKHAKFLPALTGDPLEETANKYDAIAGKQFAKNEAVVGQFGIGPDGHIAGILPKSPATTALGELAVGYEAADYTRITLTFPALRYLDTAFAFVYGGVKRLPLQQLHDTDMSLAEQPAQVLKAIPTAYVYNDQIG